MVSIVRPLDTQHYSDFLLFLKGLVASATLFVYFSIFFHTIHSFIHPFAEGPLLFPHCSSLSRGPPWGAEPGFELGPAVQQADALLSEPRRTLSEPRRTLSEPRRTLDDNY